MTGRISALAIALGALTSCAALAGDVAGERGGDVPAIRAMLAQQPGVEVIDVVGWDSFWPFWGPKDIRADLRIGAEGRLLLCELTLDTLTNGGEFGIARVGEWRPRTESDGDQWKATYVVLCVGASEVRPDSALVELTPFPMRSPIDAITNYERLHATIAAWPERRAEGPSAHGGVIAYWKARYRLDVHTSDGR